MRHELCGKHIPHSQIRKIETFAAEFRRARRADWVPRNDRGDAA